MGDKNKDGNNSKRHEYDAKCDKAKKIWRDQSGFDEELESEHGRRK